MPKASTSKYTAAMENAIKAAGNSGPLNLEVATRLASQPDFVAAGVTARGIVAKIRTMGLDYQVQARTDKTGQPVERKEQTAARIAQMLGVEGLSSLQKAEKNDLRHLAHLIENLVSVEA